MIVCSAEASRAVAAVNPTVAWHPRRPGLQPTAAWTSKGTHQQSQFTLGVTSGRRHIHVRSAHGYEYSFDSISR